MTTADAERASVATRLKSGERITGVAHSGDSVPLLEVCGHLGFDLAIIQDRYEEGARELITAATAAGLPGLVVVDEPDSHLVVRALGAGASGVLLRGVNDPDQLRRVNTAVRVASPVDGPEPPVVLGIELASVEEAAKVPELLALGVLDLVVLETRTLPRDADRTPRGAAALVRSACDSSGTAFGAVVDIRTWTAWVRAAVPVLFIDSTELFYGPATTFMRAARRARRTRSAEVR